MEKYIEYVKVRQEMSNLFERMKAMREDVIAELKQDGFSADIICDMMAIAKGSVMLACRNWERKNRKELPKLRKGRPLGTSSGKEKVKP